MSEQYQNVLSLPGSLYASGAPVMIGAGSLVEDNSTGWRLVRLELINIQQKQITAVKVKLTPLDSQGSPFGEVVTQPYMGLCLERDQRVGGDVNILLTGSDADRFSVQVTEVFFDDKSSWISDGTPWEVLPEPVELAELYSAEIVHQIRMEEGEDYRFLPQERKDLWRCVCSSWNRKEEKCCHSCQRQLSEILNLDEAGLTDRANARLAQEAADRERKEAAEEAQKQNAARLRRKLPLICGGVAAVMAVGLLSFAAMTVKEVSPVLPEDVPATVASAPLETMAVKEENWDVPAEVVFEEPDYPPRGSMYYIDDGLDETHQAVFYGYTYEACDDGYTRFYLDIAASKGMTMFYYAFMDESDDQYKWMDRVTSGQRETIEIAVETDLLDWGVNFILSTRGKNDDFVSYSVILDPSTSFPELTDGQPVGAEQSIWCGGEGDVITHGLTAQKLDNGHIRFTLDCQPPAGCGTSIFSPPNGDVFMYLRTEDTDGLREKIVFDIPEEYVRATDSITVKFYSMTTEAYVWWNTGY